MDTRTVESCFIDSVAGQWIELCRDLSFSRFIAARKVWRETFGAAVEQTSETIKASKASKTGDTPSSTISALFPRDAQG